MNRTGLTIDYLGIWNERTWCGEDYIVSLRGALDDAGFHSTTLVAPDGGPGSVDLQVSCTLLIVAAATAVFTSHTMSFQLQCLLL